MVTKQSQPPNRVDVPAERCLNHCIHGSEYMKNGVCIMPVGMDACMHRCEPLDVETDAAFDDFLRNDPAVQSALKDAAVEREITGIQKRCDAATPLPDDNTHRAIYDHGGGRIYVEGAAGNRKLIIDSYNKGDTEFYQSALDDVRRLLTLVTEQRHTIEALAPATSGLLTRAETAEAQLGEQRERITELEKTLSDTIRICYSEHVPLKTANDLVAEVESLRERLERTVRTWDAERMKAARTESELREQLEAAQRESARLSAEKEIVRLESLNDHR